VNECIFDWIFCPNYVDEIPHVHLGKTRTFSSANAEDEPDFLVL
jgi:hypothetical protein